MAIVQISKIVHRTGDLLDLPQLDVGEVGFTTDTKQLFIGNDPLNSEDDIYGKKHTEILTSATPLYFSQFTGSQDSTLNIGSDVQNGQLLVATSAGNVISWVNKGGNVGGLIDLGHTNNVKLHGGLPGYVLQTDGTGNLTWTTNGVLRYDITNISDATPAVVTIKVNDPSDTVHYDPTKPIIVNHNLTTGSAVTISGVQSATLTGTNGTNRFFVRYIDDTTFSLWTSPTAMEEPVTISGTPTANTGFVLGYIVDPTGAEPLGSNTTVQFNDGGTFNGSNKFKFDKITGNISLTGSVIATDNVEAAYFVGEASNLSNIKGANITGEVNFAATANAVAGGNVSGAVSYATTANSVAGANVSGEVSHAATANAVAGGNVSGEVHFAASANSVAGANVFGAVSYATTANAVAGANVSGEVHYAAWANGVAGANVSGEVSYAAIANSIAGSNVSGAVGLATYATTANAVAGANVSGEVSHAAVANSVAAGNISGTISFATSATSATTAGTVTTNAQPNITSVGTLANLTIGNSSVATQTDIIQLTSNTNKMYVSTDTNGVSALTKSAGKGTGVYLLDSLNRVSMMAANASASNAATEVARFGFATTQILNNLNVTGSVVAPIFGGIMQLTSYATTTARDTALPTPSAGTMIFLAATGKFQGYTGSVWADLN